jgi:iron complex outermembrane receptor protein
MVSGWGDYTFQDGFLRGFGFGGGVRYVGSSYADVANLSAVPSFVLGDAAVHYEWDQWRLALNVQNITDETYVATCQGVSACFYGDRRRVLGTVGYKW